MPSANCPKDGQLFSRLILGDLKNYKWLYIDQFGPRAAAVEYINRHMYSCSWVQLCTTTHKLRQPKGSEAFLMPSCPSSICLSVNFHLKAWFLKSCWITFSIFWHDAYQWGGGGPKGQKGVIFGIVLLFGNFLKNGLITFLIFRIQLLGNYIDQLSRDGLLKKWIIELFERSLSR